MVKYFVILGLLIVTLVSSNVLAADSSNYILNTQSGEFELNVGNAISPACTDCSDNIVIDNVTFADKTFVEDRIGGGYYEINKVVALFQVINCCACPVRVSINEAYKFVDEDSAVPEEYQECDINLAVGQNFTFDSHKGPGETIVINVEKDNIVKSVVFMIPRNGHSGDVYKRDMAGELKPAN